MSSTETAHEGRSARANAERRLGWMLCAPAVTVMLVVTAYPIAYAVWLSLQRYDLRFPDDREFIGLANYASVLSASQWWDSVLSTVIITVFSVIIELVLGFTLAWVMHRAIFGRGLVRASTLIPYGIITVVAALAWKFAFDPTTGFVNGLLGTDTAWFGARWSSFFVIILTEIWKTTPFMALLLLAGLTLVPNDLLQAARVDGASAFQRFTRVTLPLMKPAILVALLFRTLDAFRIFNNIYILTKGNHGTGSVSMLGYNNLFKAFNLGVGSAISILIFLCVAIIAFIFIKIFGAAAPGSDNEGR